MLLLFLVNGPGQNLNGQNLAGPTLTDESCRKSRPLLSSIVPPWWHLTGEVVNRMSRRSSVKHRQWTAVVPQPNRANGTWRASWRETHLNEWNQSSDGCWFQVLAASSNWHELWELCNVQVYQDYKMRVILVGSASHKRNIWTFLYLSIVRWNDRS